MDSRPGLYESVLVLDYKSLYPSIIRTFLIDPVGLVEGLRQPDDEHSVEGFRGARFSRTRHCPAGHRRTGLGGPRGGQARTQPAALAGVEDHHERLLRGAGFQRLPLLRPAPGLVHHPARASDHAPYPRADRGRGLYGDLWRYRLPPSSGSAAPRRRRPRPSAGRWWRGSTTGGAST